MSRYNGNGNDWISRIKEYRSRNGGTLRDAMIALKGTGNGGYGQRGGALSAEERDMIIRNNVRAQARRNIGRAVRGTGLSQAEIRGSSGQAWNPVYASAFDTYVSGQHGGAKNCRKSPKGRCAQWDGTENLDGCTMNQNTGRCIQEVALRRAYNVRMPPSAKQSAALERARAKRAANVAARKGGRVQAGGYYY
jgi:hypothetical protein